MIFFQKELQTMYSAITRRQQNSNVL